MKRARISIARMMGFVLISALGLVGLMRPNPFWASLIFTVAVVILIVATLNSIYGDSRSRAFWVGFAVSGWMCGVVAFDYSRSYQLERPQLVISLAIQWFQSHAHPRLGDASPINLGPLIPAPSVPPPPDLLIASSTDPSQPSAVSSEADSNLPIFLPDGRVISTTGKLLLDDSILFHQVGQSLGALFAGLLGGWYASFISGKRRSDARPAEVTPSSP